MDFETMTDDELGVLHGVVSAEWERRKTLSMVPGQIASIVVGFRKAGGDIDALISGLMNGGVDDATED